MIYNFFITLYTSVLQLLFPFSRKPRKMSKGHFVVFEKLKQQIDPKARYLWFHAASLGEFEQGRPLIEKIRAQYPGYKILLTFFSPSGYEVRKQYKGADVVTYLPMDKPRNVRRFLDLTNPKMAFFIKYEFWKNYLDELKKRHIPVYSISSIFRRDQIFFKWYGGTYRNVLQDFDYLFVQNEASKRFLSTLNIKNVSVVGDTRFDRVLEIKEQTEPLPIVEKFKGNSFTMCAGSSWAPDEDIFIDYFNRHLEMKLIIAPHVIDDAHIVEIVNKLKRPYVLHSKATMENIEQADCLIIDCFGLLSTIYRYCDVAYIGGAFGAGLHNTLEAAVYGVPVIFGPKHSKFIEAGALIDAKAGFSISSAEEFDTLMDRFINEPEYLKLTGECSDKYVKGQAGATDRILSKINL